MFLTRLGYNSKAVVTGDVTQVDLPEGRTSGLAEARELLDGVEGIAFCQFTDVDVVRHPLVQKIIVALRGARRARRERPRESKRVSLEPGSAAAVATDGPRRRRCCSATRASRRDSVTRPHALARRRSWRTARRAERPRAGAPLRRLRPGGAVGQRRASCSRPSRALRRRRRRSSSSSAARTTARSAEALTRGLASVVDADADGRRAVPRRPPRLRAARGQGARRGARPLAAPLPLRARASSSTSRAR